jgi:hypothetical protein
MSAPFPPSAGASLQSFLDQNNKMVSVGAWGPTTREKVKLPPGPFPTAGKQFGSEYFWGSKHAMSSGQKFAMWLIIIVLILAVCYFVYSRNKQSIVTPTFYF